ncbi:MAG: lamin tail domain-containing protein [Myxococcales bacterium]|nr:lamin tail domain-containing protein [Myxococcales bacterium]
MLRLLPIALMLAACDPGDGGSAPDAGAYDAAPRGQGSEASGALIVNEVAAKPASGDDWLEILNRSNDPIDLCGFFVTDSLDRLDHYHHLGGAPPPAVCTPSYLGAGEYLLIYADDDVSAGPGHAPFKLGLADEAHVVSTEGEAVDSLVFLHARGDEGLSLARLPDGEGLFWASEPTQGGANL